MDGEIHYYERIPVRASPEDEWLAFADPSGKLVIPGPFLDLNLFTEHGIAWVKTEAGAGVVDATGHSIVELGPYLQVIVEPDGSYIRAVSEDSILVLDSSGNAVLETSRRFVPYIISEGLALVVDNGPPEGEARRLWLYAFSA